MLTESEVAHYRAFGYVLLKDCLDDDHLGRLNRAFEDALESDPRVVDARANGSRDLSCFAHLDDSFGELIEHPSIMAAMRDIDGIEFLYGAGENMAAYVGDTVWHCDYQPPQEAFRPVKTTVYLDPMRAADGALQLIPGTHVPEAAATILRAGGEFAEQGGPRLRFEPSQVPSVAIDTTPRDVLLWENHMWHHAPPRKDGRPRRAIFVQYFRDPQGDVIAARGIRDTINRILERKPTSVVYTPEQMATAGPARLEMAERLERLGVGRVRGT